jgi:SAM-dependent methyltransferase
MSAALPAMATDMFVMLDPAVELLAADRAGSRILCHHDLEMGMSLPPGEGLEDLVAALMEPGTTLGSLYDGFDDHALVEELLASLRRYGLVLAGAAGDGLDELRAAGRRRRVEAARPAITIDLDAGLPLEPVSDWLPDRGEPADLRLRCARIADHGPAFARLAALRAQGGLRLHGTVVQTADLRCDPATRRALLQLSAAVALEDVPWPRPNGDVPGLADMTRGHVPVLALMAPGAAFLSAAERAGAAAWLRAAFVSGVRLRFDPEQLWPSLDVHEEDFVQLFALVQALSEEIGDAGLADLPEDAVLVGAAQPRALSAERSALSERYRKAYLRWRLGQIRSQESGHTWSQFPEVEAKFVRPEEDFLPGNPGLLVQPGQVLLDVCGGLGRVARRIAPAVGREGLVISIEMDPHLVDRARGFAAALEMPQVQFRIGVAQRLPLPGASVDAAVNEWTGAIWELGLGPVMIGEMVRVVRPGGRIAVTHRLVQLPLTRLHEPWVQYDDIHGWVRGAFDQPGVRVLAERVWGQIVPSLVGERATSWREQFIPPAIDPFDFVYTHENDAAPRADIYLTVIAERL